MTAHDGKSMYFDRKISGQVEHAINEPFLSVAIVFPGYWIFAAQPATTHTSRDEVVVQRDCLINQFGARCSHTLHDAFNCNECLSAASGILRALLQVLYVSQGLLV